MSVKVIFKEKEPELFWQYWQKFVFEHKASPRYLKTSIEYNLAYAKDIYLDKSFVYVANNQPLACIFLPVEKNGRNLSATFGNGYIDAPLFVNSLIAKKIFKIIDVVARENLLTKVMFSVDSLSGNSYNYLIKFGYFDSSVLTYIFDLPEDLLGSCRKGHRCDIKNIIKDENFRTFFVDEANPVEELFKEYVRLHHKCSGRITRSQATFDMQFKKMKAGEAFLAGLKYQKTIVAFVYFEYKGDKAIYASTADDPDYDKLPLYHILVFRAMEYLKKRGVCFVDTGQPSCPTPQFDYYIDQKQANIALFKRGFGGHFRENFRGIKYFSQAAFEEDVGNLIKNFKIL